MPMPDGLRHWPTMSGYFSRKSCAPAASATNRPASAMVGNRLRQAMADLLPMHIPIGGWPLLSSVAFLLTSSLLRLLEIFQTGRRLVLPGGHQEAIRAQHVVFLADLDVIVVL